MLKNNPLVSIIIPTYNHANFLKDALDSVLNQTYSNFQVIIVNNYSEDNTIEIIEGYRNQKLKIHNFRNNGIIAASRNFGIQHADGEYVAFLDSDDLWLPEKLEMQLSTFNKYPDLLLVSTNMRTFPQKKKNYLKMWKNKFVSFNNLLSLRENPILNSSVMLKKEVFEKIGFLDEDPRLRAIEDYDFWLRVARFKEKSCYILRDELLRYRIHSSNISNYNDPKLFEKYEIILNKYIDYNESRIKKLLKKRRHEIIKRSVKYSFYQSKIGFSSLFKLKEVKFLDKLEIFVKKFILKFLNN